jgi:hypothetical protein
MRRCRCCRQSWPIEFFTPVGRWRRATCLACRAGCKRFRERHYATNRETMLRRSIEWRARLRADVQAIRAQRAA